MALESIEAIQQFFDRVENRETFFARVHRFAPPYHRESTLIADAYQVSKDAFRGVRRERYFEHCRAVAVILIDIVGVKSAWVIAAALLHDIVEDCDGASSVFSKSLVLRRAFLLTP